MSAHAEFNPPPESASGSARMHCPTAALSMPHIGSSSIKNCLTDSWKVTASMRTMPEAAASLLLYDHWPSLEHYAHAHSYCVRAEAKS